MNLLKSTGTIGGLTMVSRIAGFAREMLMSRILGAGVYTDAFYVAFRLPNTFRRLFGEGAFSAGFVPLYSQRLQSGGEAEAKRFSRGSARRLPADPDPVHLAASLLGDDAVHLRRSPAGIGEQLAFGTFLTRITFPYLLLISLVSLFSAASSTASPRFTAAAFAPALLNLAMLLALIFVRNGRRSHRDGASAIAVTVGGVLQLGLLLIACKRAGHRPQAAQAAS